MDEHEKLIASYISKFADVALSIKIKILLKIKWRIDTELLNCGEVEAEQFLYYSSRRTSSYDLFCIKECYSSLKSIIKKLIILN